MQHPTERQVSARVAAALFILVLLFVAGSFLYTRVGGVLFRQTHIGRVPTPLLLGLAIIGGAASFFSPCSIAITPSFLTYFVSGDGAGARRDLLQGSTLVASGIVSFYVLAGLLVGLVGVVVYNVLIYLLPVVGIAFFGLGVLVLTGRGDVLSGFQKWNPIKPYYERSLGDPTAKRSRELFAFGAAYGAASHTCTLPIFLGIVLVPLAVGNYGVAAVTTFLYGLALAMLLVVMAFLGQGVLLRLRRAWGKGLQWATGGLFLVTALYLFYYFAQNGGAFL